MPEQGARGPAEDVNLATAALEATSGMRGRAVCRSSKTHTRQMTSVYVPDVGFRQPGVRLVSPVIGELRGRTMTLRHLLATTDSTELIYDLTCLDDDMGFGPRQDAITVTIDGVEHRLERGAFSLSPQGAAVRRHLRSTSVVPAHAGEVELTIGIERLGEFRLGAQLTPFPEGRASIRHEIEASTTHGAITLIVHAFAAAPEETAVDLEVVLEEKGVSCAGIGGLHGMRKGPTELSLRDDAGRTYSEHWCEPPAVESKDVALFDPLQGDVRELELTGPVRLPRGGGPPRVRAAGDERRHGATGASQRPDLRDRYGPGD